jgi:hypothetical protein
MRKAFELSPKDDILTKVSSYVSNDGSDLVHFHNNPHLSFVIKGGGTIKSKFLMCERLPGNLIFSYAGARHQCIEQTSGSKYQRV